jgi:hypothetical protein
MMLFSCKKISGNLNGQADEFKAGFSVNYDTIRD